MSQPGGKKTTGKVPPNDGKEDKGDDKKKDKDKEPKDSKDKKKDKEKDESSSVVDEAAPPAKPQSAGASVRDAAQRMLTLTQKKWAPVDQVLKNLEKHIANAGEDANTIPLLAIADAATGMTPLMYAVKDNRSSILDRLIELGCDVGARNNDNYNALHIASMHSREDVVKLLLTKRGVDPYSEGGLPIPDPKTDEILHEVF